ncbi:MAG: AAA family ATPase [Candidatus Bipolaricaulota bacterium]|nr:AAA family ATPase [Candidatus Bipolaricaulota bacterium]
MARKSIREEENLLDLLSKAPPEEAGPALRDQTPLARDQFQLEHLEIENLWSYKRASVQFEPGITVIAGANGSGKSSLLESIFFALYGSEARHVIGRNLDEILRIGADSGSVRLRFLYSGKRYTAEIALRRQGGTVKSERSGCQLVSEDGSVWVGTENVIAEIERFFGMDREGFANCVYVRQGEIDRLIRADRRTREQMLDGLLGLYKIDLFVNPRSKEALRALNRRLSVLEERSARLRHEIDALEGEELAKQKAQLTDSMERLQSDLVDLDERRASAHKLLQSYEDSLQQFAQAAQELQQIDHELAEKQSRLAQREAERKEFEDELERLSERHQKSALALKRLLAEPLLQMDGARVLESLDQAATSDDVAIVPEKLREGKARIEAQRTKLQEAREELTRLTAERAHRERAIAHAREQYEELSRTHEHEAQQIKQMETGLATLALAYADHERSVTAHLSTIAEGARKLGVPFPTGLPDARHLEKIRAQWAGELRALEEQYDQAKRAVLQAKTQCDALRQEFAHKQALLAAGRCPTCGQAVHPEHLSESLGVIEPKIAELERAVQHEERELERIAEKLTLWKDVQSGLDQIIFEIERLEARRAEIALTRTALESAVERHQRLQERMAHLQNQIESETQTVAAQQAEQEKREAAVRALTQELNQALNTQEKLERIKSEIENLLRVRQQWREKQAVRKTLLESLNELRGDIARLHDRRMQMQERLQGQNEIASKRAQVQELLSALDKERATLQERYDQLAQARGIVQGRLEHLKRLQDEMARVTREQEEVKKLMAELDEIVSVYQSTKVALRQRNLEALNYYFNEFFSLMDSGDSYSRVMVRDDYEIEVELKNGRTINPSLMSGGERALTNIALRCAIHQVLAKAVRRMPLILDEPTIYLDRDRIHRLQFLLEDLGRRVGQVIVVSHEVGLVEGADHEYRTEKGSDNISTIYKVR